MSCEHKDRILIAAKCDDRFVISTVGALADTLGGDYGPNYIPEGFNIGQGDTLEFEFCVNCGHIIGTWPIEQEILKELLTSNNPKEEKLK